MTTMPLSLEFILIGVMMLCAIVSKLSRGRVRHFFEYLTAGCLVMVVVLLLTR